MLMLKLLRIANQSLASLDLQPDVEATRVAHLAAATEAATVVVVVVVVALDTVEHLLPLAMGVKFS